MAYRINVESKSLDFEGPTPLLAINAIYLQIAVEN